MKKFLTIMLCFIMLLSAALLIGCDKKDSDKKLTFEKAKSNVESYGFEVELYDEDDLYDFEMEIYYDYGEEVTIKNGFATEGYDDELSGYIFILVYEFGSSTEAKKVLEAAELEFIDDGSYATTKGSLLIVADSEEAANRALQAKKGSGAPSFGSNSGMPSFGSNSNSGSASSIDFSTMVSNLQSNGYSVEYEDYEDLEDLSDEFYEYYSINVSVYNAVNCTNYNTYEFVSVYELGSTSQAQSLYNAASNDSDMSYARLRLSGKYLIIGTSESAIDHAFERGNYDTSTGANTNTSRPQASSSSSSSYYSLSWFASNLQDYGFTVESYSYSEIDSLESSFYSYYSVYVDIYDVVEVDESDYFIVIMEFYSYSDAETIYYELSNDSDYYYYEIEREGDIVLLAYSETMMECAYGEYYGSIYDEQDKQEQEPNENENIGTKYYSIDEIVSNLSNYGISASQLTGSDFAEIESDLVLSYSSSFDVYAMAQGSDDYDNYILAIEFMSHSEAVTYYNYIEPDLGYEYYITVSSDTVFIADAEYLILCAYGTY